MAGKTWSQHAGPHIKKAMKKAIADARKSWKGGKQMTAAQKKRLASLQNKRLEINKTIRKMRGKD